MPLAVDLEASFTAGGFDLQARVTGLDSLLSAVSPVPVSFDVSSTSSITDLLSQVDTGAIAGLVGPVVGQLTQIVPGVPDVEPLLGRLHTVLSTFELATSGQLAGLLRRLDGEGLPVSAGAVRRRLHLLHLRPHPERGPGSSGAAAAQAEARAADIHG